MSKTNTTNSKQIIINWFNQSKGRIDNIVESIGSNENHLKDPRFQQMIEIFSDQLDKMDAFLEH